MTCICASRPHYQLEHTMINEHPQTKEVVYSPVMSDYLVQYTSLSMCIYVYISTQILTCWLGSSLWLW